MYNIIYNNNVPVVLTGSFKDQYDNFIVHAVLAYGWTTSNKVVVHLGLPTTSSNPDPGNAVHILNSGSNCISPFNSLLYLTNPQLLSITSPSDCINHWCLNAVRYCYRYGIMSKVNTFSPNSFGKRSFFINSLYQLIGAPQVSTSQINTVCSLFSDVNSSSQYLNAIAWAYHSMKDGDRLLNGYGNGTVGYDNNITREEVAAFMHRFYNIFNCIADASHTYTWNQLCNLFSDANDISEYFKDDVLWAVNYGVLKGDGAGHLNPGDEITRGAIAQVIYQFSHNNAHVGNNTF